MSQSLFTYSIVSLSLEIETEREISLSLLSLSRGREAIQKHDLEITDRCSVVRT